MAQERPVEVPVERERAEPARANQSVAVEQHAPAARDPLEHLGREVVAQQRRHVRPLDSAQHALRLVGFGPRLPDRVDAHLAAAVGVVPEGEGRRLAGRNERDRQAERRETTVVRAPLGLTALRDHDRLLLERPQRTSRVPGAASDARGPAVYDVTRKRADHGERSHDPQG